MTKLTAFQEIKKTLETALISDHDPFVDSQLDELIEDSDVIKRAEEQLLGAKKLRYSVTINARFHQGRVLSKYTSSRTKNTLGMNRRDHTVASRIYEIFDGHEYLIKTYWGKEDTFYRLSDREVKQLKDFLDSYVIEDPINKDLNDLLNFDCEDTIFPAVDRDVIPDLDIGKFVCDFDPIK